MCSQQDKCSAPLCPLNNFQGIWYSDEPICTSHNYSHELVIRNQRKIQVRFLKGSITNDTFYIFEMINRPIMITKSISGIPGDTYLHLLKSMIQRWCEKRPGMSDEFRKARRERMRKVHERKQSITGGTE